MSVLTHQISRPLLRLAGYRVEEDADQPGMFVWARIERGRIVEGCDVSLESWDLAWEQVRQMVAGSLDDEGVSAQDWNVLPPEQHERLIIECLGQSS